MTAFESLAGGSSPLRGILTGLSSAALASGAVIKAAHRVEANEMGVRTRRGGKTHRTRGERAGELFGIVGPGMHAATPFFSSIKAISVADRLSSLPDITVDRCEGQHRIISSIIWRVLAEDDAPYKALFNAKDQTELTQVMTGLCVSGLREVMESLPGDKFKDSQEVNGSVQEIVNEPLADQYGATLSRLNLHEVALTLGEKLYRAGSNPYSSNGNGLGSLAVASDLQH